MTGLALLLFGALRPQLEAGASELVKQGLTLFENAMNGKASKEEVFAWLERYADEIHPQA